MKALIFGTTGKVATELALAFSGAGHDVLRTDRKVANMEIPWALPRLLDLFEADVVINATAMNGMEQCTEDPARALLVNGVGPGWIAGECYRRGIDFIHYSTDYVFSGQPDGLTEDMVPVPAGTYGWSKRQGEEAVARANSRALIFRVSSVYGRRFEGPLGPVAQAQKGKGTPEDPIKVLHQFCSPTSARTIAAATLAAAERQRKGTPLSGIYHLASCTGVWKVDFAREAIHRILGPVGPTGRAWEVGEGTLPVPRPVHTQLDVTRFQEAFGHILPTVEEDFLKTLPMILAQEGIARRPVTA